MPDAPGFDLPGIQVIEPDWPAPDNVRAFTTTRTGGFSMGRWSSLNLGSNCGDDPQHVEQNRQRLRRLLPADPHWLKQVHGNHVVKFSENTSTEPEADAIVCTRAGQVCAILHADCLPVLFCNKAGTQVAAAHAGWRGLSCGILEATISMMDCNPNKLMAWLGPAIGPQAFEVGQDVYDSFVNADSEYSTAFKPHGDRHLADLYQLARMLLIKAGINQISGGQHCTYAEQGRFFSYRRDGKTGRMATVIWLQVQKLDILDARYEFMNKSEAP
jgi:hypothetical protein